MVLGGNVMVKIWAGGRKRVLMRGEGTWCCQWEVCRTTEWGVNGEEQQEGGRTKVGGETLCKKRQRACKQIDM